MTRDGERRTVAIRGVLESNDGQVLRAAALEGLGILVQPTYVIYEDIVAGRLVPVLPDWRLEPAAVFAVTPRRDEQPAKVRHALQALQAHFGLREG